MMSSNKNSQKMGILLQLKNMESELHGGALTGM